MALTAAGLLDYAACCDCEVYLRPDGTPAVRGQPSAALLGALTLHRDEIIRLLGGVPARPAAAEVLAGARRCPGHAVFKGHYECGVWVYEPEDSEAFCRQSRCPLRAECRRRGGPFGPVEVTNEGSADDDRYDDDPGEYGEYDGPD